MLFLRAKIDWTEFCFTLCQKLLKFLRNISTAMKLFKVEYRVGYETQSSRNVLLLPILEKTRSTL